MAKMGAAVRIRLTMGLALAMFAHGAAAAAPAGRARDVPNAVTTVGRDQLEELAPRGDFKSILDIHNRLRSEVGSPPLRWNHQLAARAEGWAKTIADCWWGCSRHSARRCW